MKNFTINSVFVFALLLLINISVASSKKDNTFIKQKVYEELISVLDNNRVLIKENSLLVSINPGDIFESNSAEFKPKVSTDFTHTTNIIKKYNKLSFNVSVHTSTEGAEDINLLISQKRALAINKFLIKSHISSKRFISEGKGEKESTNKSIERIEFELFIN